MASTSAIMPVLVNSGAVPETWFTAFSKLHYDSAADPFAVTIDFAAQEHLLGGQAATSWSFSRELMRSGLTASQKSPAGIGDVQCSLSDSGVNFLIKLRSPSGEAEILFPLEEVQFFINNVFVLYPSDEMAEEDLDSVLTAILEEGIA
jgi:hypothetical protein